jgi:Sulfotransferase family
MIAQLDAEYIKTRPTKALSRLTAHLLLQGRPLTTSTRWLNPLLMAQYGLVKRLPMPRKVVSPVFVLGTGRSGTTILGKVLGMHRDLLFLNEPKALWHSACALDDVMGSYQLGEARYVLGADDADEATGHVIRRLYSYALLVTGSRRVLDKYPEMIFRVPFIKAIFPDAKLLFLVRNGYDALRSITAWSKRAGRDAPGPAGGREDWWGLDRRKWKLLVRDVVAGDEALADRVEAISSLTRHEDMAAVEWAVTMRTGLRLMQDQPGLLHEVRYETLCREPGPMLRGLCGFCELRDDPRFLAYATRTLSPVPARPPAELGPVIRDVFMDTMRRLDYPADPSPAQAPAQ